ncbi:putative RNA polymerase II associated factor subunit [Halotydeus destructor]|nr:putative RNA polymerase II associated factor subunit [Halotydeus destructor]
MRSFCDQVGVTGVADETLVLLNEDVNYRLRQLVQNAAQLMKHSRRRKLLCSDINEALKDSDCEPIQGHGISCQDLNVTKLPDDKVFFVDEPEIDLIAYANDIISSNNRLKLKVVNTSSANLKWLSPAESKQSKSSKIEKSQIKPKS